MSRLGKFGVLAFGLAVVLAAGPRLAAAQNTQDFVIKDFTADYYLDRNSAQTATLHTTESITAEFPNFDQNHGILRAIPEKYLNHTVSLQIDSVTDETGSPIKYTTSTQNDNLVLKIGDADTFVHGNKIYKITYDQRNVVSILSDHDEFYWDVNGDQWSQPFAQVTARLHVPPGLVNSLQPRHECFVGIFGTNDTSRCTINSIGDSGSTIITSQAQNLGADETMTIVNGFQPGTFKLGPEIAAAQRAERLKIAGIIAGMLALPIVSFVYLYARWRKYGRDPRGRGVIIPEYQPPKGLNVLTSDYVLKEAMNNKAISALVIELAIRKYLSIYEVKKAKRLQKDITTYKLKLIKDPSDLSAEEKQVVDMFFDAGAEVGAEADLSELKNKLSSGVSSLKKMLGKDLLAAGYFKNNPNSAGGTYYLIGGLLSLGGFFFLSFIFPPLGISVGVAGLIFLLFAHYMPARSDLGITTRDHMLGLRDYIKLAEADRLKFLQSPQGAEKIEEAGLKPGDSKFKVKLFESLLPYAMVFNLEKDWARQFQDVYTSPPDWYNGNWATFNAVYLASSLGAFNTASAVTFVSPSSSGSSGFGGGGFSGGGGGGGGGGGW